MSQVIADAIADHILEQNLPTGARLANEAQMVEQYGAGRSSVREALRLLEADGLVDIRPGLAVVLSSADPMSIASPAG